MRAKKTALDTGPWTQLWKRLVQGDLANVRFSDMLRLAQACGFVLRRVKGSHHLMAHPEAAELINLQQVDGHAKPYQIRQFLRLVERYNLHIEDAS